MSVTITTIASTDLVSDSRAIINDNFSALKTAVEAGSGGISVLSTSAFNTATTTATVQGGLSTVVLTDAPYMAQWNGSAWKFYVNGRLTTPMDDASFSWTNQNSCSVTTTNRVVHLSRAGNGGGNLTLRSISVPGATPYTITACLLLNLPNESSVQGGMWIGDGTKFETCGCGMTATEGCLVQYWNSYSSFNFAIRYNYRIGLNGKPIWLRIKNDGTDLTHSFSFDGLSYMDMYQHAKGGFLGTITQAGIYMCSGSSNTAEVCDISVLGWDVS
jgi:hypothetical protein